ncbi:RsmB/NOP family class I SAM-dependent RNA methyltransferase [bacterium]|nr:RsmB/NOP family class I SAM-dependent RNA methyltransferase [bacterium]
MKTLPEQFTNIILSLYKSNYKDILSSYNKEKPTTFRVNLLKHNSPEILQSLRNQGFVFDKGEIENSYIIKKSLNTKISETMEFNKGLIYVQELSSMIPPLVLDPKEGEYILDMTAAPGSKTTQMAVLSNNKAHILAVEKDLIRYKKLKYNTSLQGANITTKLDNAIILHKKYPEFINFFDKILLDAPCSSEGRFNLNKPKSYKYWNLKKVKEMQNQQRRLLNTAAQLLKPGGTLVYSTCTLNTKENEENVNWILEKYGSLKVKNINIDLKNKKSGFTKIEGKELNKDISKTLRVIPNGVYGGFFITKLVKSI